MAVYRVQWTDSHGRKRRIRLYLVWRNIHNRVAGHTKDGKGSARWKGLEVGWKNYAEFHTWAVANGYRLNRVLDRRKSDEGYTPTNCQFITAEENARRAAKMHKKKCKCFWCSQKRARKEAAKTPRRRRRPCDLRTPGEGG